MFHERLVRVRLAIILPTLGEGDGLAQALCALQDLRAQGVRLIVVDGAPPASAQGDGSHARNVAHLVDDLLHAPRGRASQMNAGAWHARSAAQGPADVLLFLHVDTRLPGNGTPALRAIEGAMAAGASWGRFDVDIDAGAGASVCLRAGLACVARMMNLRSRLSGVATGDQAIWVRRDVFERLGGFAPIALMEDIEWSARAGRAGLAPACLRERVQTSGRRWRQHGLLRTIVGMWRLRLAFWRGADPHDLARRYGYAPRAPAAVAILGKAPVAGLAKTRLIPALGASGAARAQRGFILRTWATARAASTGAISLWCAPDGRHPTFRALARRFGVNVMPQVTGDLGARMGAVVARHFALDDRSGQQTPAASKPTGPQWNQPLILVGTDCPVLTAEHLQAAADALIHHDVVLIPAEDGGYVLIGFRRPLLAAFEQIDWSTPRVLAQTRERLQRVGIQALELPALWDVDEPADWARWCALQPTPALGHACDGTTLLSKTIANL